MNPGDINWLGSLVAAIASFALGALWYSPVLFAKPWMRGFGFDQTDLEKGNMGLIFGAAFLLQLLAALAFSKLLGIDPGLQEGLCWGLVVGLFFGATSLGVHYLFESRPLNIWLINCGYTTLCFVLYGLVLGLWP